MFQQGLSGLNGAAKSLSVIGNNIANASTVGFKGSQAQFADLYANSLNGVSGKNAGIGVNVARIAQQFTQGNIESSSNPFDISINGGGFFRMSVNGTIQYTRNGQFHPEKDGTIANAQGAVLTGFLADKNGNIIQGAPVPIKIDFSDLTPKQTTEARFNLNLSSNEDVPANTPFSAADPKSYNKLANTTVFDSLGNDHIMSTYYVKTNANTWDVYVASDGTEAVAAKVAAAVLSDAPTIAARAAYDAAVKAVPPVPANITAATLAYATAAGTAMRTAATAAGASAPSIAALTAAFTGATSVGNIAGINPDQMNAKLAETVVVPAVKAGTLIFTQNGVLDATAMAAPPLNQTLPLTISLPIFPSTGSSQPLTITTDFNVTQYGGKTSEKPPEQDGYESGTLERYETDENGVIQGHYSNGMSRPLAQIAMADFNSPDGLTPLGNNAWAESSASGPPGIGVPNSGGFGQLRASSVEASNVDLTAELVNMITAQRVYQANAQTIKTEDSILQTLVNLR